MTAFFHTLDTNDAAAIATLMLLCTGIFLVYAGALRLWERRITRPVSDDEIQEYAAAHARTDDEWDAILAAVDWDALDAEVGTRE